ncbi:hypothetical protein GCM10011609_79230 [Lentzea pudingi]|uniref:Secreted protein n=1 Tax=Lentzea pudingi TaxID=1789439 RepID=A0ABQ2IQS8_9PSEU|nr:hypothetical protein [Lentzea pudingi]GGN25111.1 hypothetical protein GCM10011609_79230 [Lentzea pudingi]
MDPLLVVFLISLVVLGVVVVLSIVSTGEEDGRIRSATTAIRSLERRAATPGWTKASDQDDMPAGRMSGLPGPGRGGTVAGVHEGRAFRVAVFSSTTSVGLTSTGYSHVERTVPALVVVVVDAPELTGDLRMDPPRPGTAYEISGDLAPDAERRVVAQLKSYQPPAVDIAGGVACFTFTDLDLVEQIDDVAAMACDVVEILANAKKPAPPAVE